MYIVVKCPENEQILAPENFRMTAFSGGMAPIEICLFLYSYHGKTTIAITHVSLFQITFSTVPLLGTYTPLHWHKTWTMFTTLTNDPGYQRNSLSDISIYFEKYGITTNDLFPSTLWPCLVGILTHFFANILVYEAQAWAVINIFVMHRFVVRPSVFLYARPSRLGVPTGCSGKNVFFHNSLQRRLHRCKALNAMRVYSHSYWLVIFLYNQ